MNLLELKQKIEVYLKDHPEMADKELCVSSDFYEYVSALEFKPFLVRNRVAGQWITEESFNEHEGEKYTEYLSIGLL